MSVKASGGGSSYAVLQVYVESGDIFAVISGGSTRAVSRGLNVTLDASASADTDLDPSQDQNLRYSWKCFVLSLNNFGASFVSVHCGGGVAGR